MLTLPTENTDMCFLVFCARASSIGADFDRFRIHTGVVAGLVPATPNLKVQSEHNRGGRDESAFTRVFNALLPGHDTSGC